MRGGRQHIRPDPGSHMSAPNSKPQLVDICVRLETTRSHPLRFWVGATPQLLTRPCALAAYTRSNSAFASSNEKPIPCMRSVHQRPPPTGGDNHKSFFTASKLTYKANVPVPAAYRSIHTAWFVSSPRRSVPLVVIGARFSFQHAPFQYRLFGERDLSLRLSL